jgi:hypothetical protein
VLAEDDHRVGAVLPVSSPYGHPRRLRVHTGSSAVTAPDLAEDDAKVDQQLSLPFVGVQARVPEEGQQVVAVVPPTKHLEPVSDYSAALSEHDQRMTAFPLTDRQTRAKMDGLPYASTPGPRIAPARHGSFADLDS